MNHRFTSLLLVSIALSSVVLVRCSSHETIVKGSSSGSSGGGEDGGPIDEEGGVEEDGAVPDNCIGTEKATTVAKIGSAEVDEASGIGVSKKNPGVYWVHNDSGDSARAFAIDAKGALVATVAFDDAKPTDIEDMAIEDDGDTSYLYFGDIGDNGASRKQLTIHRVAEPALGSAADQKLSIKSETMTVVYEDGAHNAETLMFDPLDKALVIVTKAESGGAFFHRIGPFKAGSVATTKAIGKADIVLATGGEISRDGRYIGVRNYAKSGYLWTREEGETLEAALARPACKIPIADVGQGEAFDFLVDSSGYVTTVEGASSPILQTLFKP